MIYNLTSFSDLPAHVTNINDVHVCHHPYFSLDFANPAVQKNPHTLTPGLGTRLPMLGESARVVERTADTTTKPRRSAHRSIGEVDRSPAREPSIGKP